MSLITGVAPPAAPRSSPLTRWTARLTGARWLAVPLGVFLATRLIVFYAGFAGTILVPMNAAVDLRPDLARGLLVDQFVRGDAIGYLGLIQTGYWYDPVIGIGSAALPPLFPILIATVRPLTDDPALGALLVANLAFACALALLYGLAANRVGSGAAGRAVLLLCLLPYGFLFAAPYPHALALLLALLALGALSAGRTWASVVLGTLAALAHPLGLALWPAQVVARARAWRSLDRPSRSLPGVAGDVLALGATPAALAAVAWYLRRVGDLPTHQIVAVLTGVSGRAFGPAQLGTGAGAVLAFNLGLGLLALTTTPRAAALLGLPYATFQVGVLVLAFVADPTSLGAATLLAFPSVIVAASYLAEHDLVEILAVTFAGLALAVTAAAFVNWYPIGGTLATPPSSGPRATLAAFHARLLHQGVSPTGLPRDLFLRLDNAILLLGFDPPKDRYAPGDRVPVPLYLYTLETSQRGYVLSARLRDAAGRPVAQSDRTLWGSADRILFESGQPTVLLQDHYFQENLALRLDPNLPSGRYTLDVQVFAIPSFALVPLATADNRPVDRVVHVDLTVANPRDIGREGTFAIPRPVRADLGGAIRLLGDDLSIGPGAIDVPLYWEARARPDHAETVFVQLLDPTGKVVAQSDSYPLGGRFPTTAWAPGDVVRDVHRLTLPPGLPAGTYRLIAGMYRLETLQRLPVLRAGWPSDDHVDLGTVELKG